MYDNLVITLRNNADHYMTVEGAAGVVHLLTDAADAIESLKHTVEILCGAKINLVRCCECVYHDDESQYHYCRKWRRNCPNDSDFFCKWGKRKGGGQDDV